MLKEKYTVEMQILVDQVPHPAVSVMSTSVKSTFICFLECVNHAECVAFAFSETSNVCTGRRYQNPSPSVLIMASGFNFYAFIPGT